MLGFLLAWIIPLHGFDHMDALICMRKTSSELSSKLVWDGGFDEIARQLVSMW